MELKKLKILQITSSFEPVTGGMEKVVGDLSRELAIEGHEVTVLSTNLYAPQAKIGEQAIYFTRNGKKRQFKVARVPNKLFLAGYGYSPGVVGWLKEHYKELDVAHCHGYNRHASESALTFLQGKLPTAFTAHGFYHTGKRKLLKKLHEKFLGARAARAASACVAITEDDAKTFEQFGVAKEKIVIIPNGVEVEKFGKKLTGKNEFAKYSPYVLFVGRLHSSKGLQFLLEAVKQLPCKLVVVGGDAGFEKNLKEMAAAHGLEPKVVLAGQLEEKELVKAYQGCEMLVLPSEWEAFGVVLVEAMAAGKPVVASKRGAMPHLVKDGENGFLVAFGDSLALKQKISLLLKDKKLSSKMGLAGRKFAQQFSWHSVAAKTLALYEKLLKTKYSKPRKSFG